MWPHPITTPTSSNRPPPLIGRFSMDLTVCLSKEELICTYTTELSNMEMVDLDIHIFTSCRW